MKNKKIIAIILAILAFGAVSAISTPRFALAQGTGGYGIEETAGEAGLNQGNTSLPQIIGSVIKGALTLVGVIFLVLMIYAGYLWMIARGNEEKVSRSLDTIKAAIIGIIIVALAYAITNYVVNEVLTQSSAPAGGTTSTQTTT